MGEEELGDGDRVRGERFFPLAHQAGLAHRRHRLEPVHRLRTSWKLQQPTPHADRSRRDEDDIEPTLSEGDHFGREGREASHLTPEAIDFPPSRRCVSLRVGRNEGLRSQEDRTGPGPRWVSPYSRGGDMGLR